MTLIYTRVKRKHVNSFSKIIWPPNIIYMRVLYNDLLFIMIYHITLVIYDGLVLGHDVQTIRKILLI